MTIEYGLTWQSRGQRLDTPITEAEARARHLSGAHYSAHVRRADGTTYLVLVTHLAGWGVQIALHDAIGRAEKTLIYSEREGRMLLAQRKRRWLLTEDPGPHAKRDATSVERYIFKIDGKYYRYQTDLAASPSTSVETEGYCTLEDHWEALPEFGNYEAYTRFDRKIVEIPPPVKKRGSKAKAKTTPEEEKKQQQEWKPRSGVHFTSVATRSYPLTPKEKAAIAGIFQSTAVDKVFKDKSDLLSLNWEPFLHYPEGDRPPQGETFPIFGGETILPDNTERAMLEGVTYWCQVFSLIRRAVPNASWEVLTEDHEMIWDEGGQAYDPDR